MNQKTTLSLINQLVDLEQKTLSKNQNYRHFKRIKSLFEEEGYKYISPKGEVYNDQRTDLEAQIEGDINKELRITEVIKPIIYFEQNGQRTLTQKGVVIVEN